MSVTMSGMKCDTPCGVICKCSEELNPLSHVDVNININSCPAGDAHTHTRLTACLNLQRTVICSFLKSETCLTFTCAKLQ